VSHFEPRLSNALPISGEGRRVMVDSSVALPGRAGASGSSEEPRGPDSLRLATPDEYPLATSFFTSTSRALGFPALAAESSGPTGPKDTTCSSAVSLGSRLAARRKKESACPGWRSAND
jgi:hypothetical protein